MKCLKKVVQPDGRSVRVVNFKCGIYEILHRRTLRRYVGSSQEVEKRLYWHLTMLRKGKHHCSFLQNVWNKYGEYGFEFYLLEECHIDHLNDRENFHMKSTSQYVLMNSQPEAGNARGYKMSEEAKAKIAAKAKIVANNEEGRRVRRERALRMHSDGRIPYGPRQCKDRVCKKCGSNYQPDRYPDNTIKQSKYCLSCRPPVHKGGYYKYEKALWN